MKPCHPPTNRDRIQKSSRKIIRILNLFRWLIPLTLCLIWLGMNRLPLAMQQEILPEFVRLPLPLLTRLAAFAITMIPAGIMIYGITILIRLFRLYRDGRIFQPENVRCLQSLSRVLMVLCFAGILANTLLSLALTLHHPPGERMIQAGIRGQDITLFILGYILTTIARVMHEGCRLQEDQNLTV